MNVTIFRRCPGIHLIVDRENLSVHQVRQHTAIIIGEKYRRSFDSARHDVIHGSGDIYFLISYHRPQEPTKTPVIRRETGVLFILIVFSLERCGRRSSWIWPVLGTSIGVLLPGCAEEPFFRQE